MIRWNWESNEMAVCFSHVSLYWINCWRYSNRREWFWYLNWRESFLSKNALIFFFNNTKYIRSTPQIDKTTIPSSLWYLSFSSSTCWRIVSLVSWRRQSVLKNWRILVLPTNRLIAAISSSKDLFCLGLGYSKKRTLTYLSLQTESSLVQYIV